MQKIYAKLLEEDQKELWNNFVSNSPWGDILQFWQWGEVKKQEGWTPYRVGVFIDDKLVLAAQCLLKKASLLGNYLYVPHGPVFHNRNDLEGAITPFKLFITDFARRNGCFAVEIEPKLANHITGDLSENLQPFTNDDLKKLFWKAGFLSTSRNMQPKFKLLYDLDLADEQLLALMKKSTRYNIRLADKKGVAVNQYLAADPVLPQKLKVFYKLLQEMQERAKGYPIRPYKSFEELFKQFEGTENLALFEASYNGETIAMNISERTGKWASSFYAGSNRLYPEVKAMYLLRWKSILAAKAFGSKVYDFWGIIPNSDQHKGYSDNKLSFGGTRIDTLGLMALPINNMKYFVWNKLLPLRSKLPK